MKLRNKIALVILLAILYCIVVEKYHSRSPEAAPAVSTEDLQKFYDQSNDEYFNGRLPKNVVIDQTETNPAYMATTQETDDGRMYIKFNPRYTLDQTNAYLTLLHEECHVSVWKKKDVGHGPLWRTCMLQLDMQGAFRELLIDEYREK